MRFLFWYPVWDGTNFYVTNYRSVAQLRQKLFAHHQSNSKLNVIIICCQYTYRVINGNFAKVGLCTKLFTSFILYLYSVPTPCYMKMCFLGRRKVIVLNYFLYYVIEWLDMDVCDVAKKSIYYTLFINGNAITWPHSTPEVDYV